MNVSEFRKLRKMTQEDLGQALGVTQGLISQIERGETEPGGRLAKRIVEYSGGLVTLNDLYPAKDQAA